MRLLLLMIIMGALSPSVAGQSAPAPVCEVARDAAKLIGKRVRVEGYVWDLGSHGFVLTGRRQDCKFGQLGLWTQHVDSSPTWRKAFATSLGPKRAILVGIVRWQKTRLGGRNSALTIERVDYLSRREAGTKDFW